MAEPSTGAATGQPRSLPPRYEAIRLLGKGGMASVWCARDTILGRRVAVKLLSEAISADLQAQRHFMREARAAARLSGHPHVVTIFDVGEGDGYPYIVMEHLAGGTVADAIRLRAHSREEALRWIEEAAMALDHAHAHGIVHRDVKPANMLLGTDRSLHLGDFGIASLGADQTLANDAALYATAAYISPEQALGHPATAASDGYALAVTAFELLTGERPYLGETFAAQARAHVEQPPPHASWRATQLPAEVDAVLARGMAKSPAERWPTAGELAVALRRALEPEPQAVLAAAGPGDGALPGAGPRAGTIAARRHGRRRWHALGGAAMAALAAGVLLGSQHGAGAGQGPRVSAGISAPAHTIQAPVRERSRTATVDRRGTAAAAGLSAAALEARGHQLMLDGDYAEALPVLREAVRRADPSSLTYAYALFDLGRTLRLDGQPAAAIPILERRLQIPNQPQVVAYELALAREQAGQQGSEQQADVPAPAPAPAGAPSSQAPARRPRHLARAGRYGAPRDVALQTDVALVS